MLAVIHWMLAQAAITSEMPGVVAGSGAVALNVLFWLRMEHRLTKLETLVEERKPK